MVFQSLYDLTKEGAMNTDFPREFKNLTILSVVGARPNFMKIAPIARTIERNNRQGKTTTVKHVIVNTGKHYDEVMSKLFLEDLELQVPDVNLHRFYEA